MKDFIDRRHRRTHGRTPPGVPRDPPANARGGCSATGDPVIECLFRGYARCAEAEHRLDGCVSDEERLVLEEHLKRVKRELQQILDDYVDARIERWLVGHPDAEKLA
jgi:hypothetical protein